MAIPLVDTKKIIEALDDFDKNLRNTEEWKSWETKKSQVYAIDYQGNKYPPKKIVSLATEFQYLISSAV